MIGIYEIKYQLLNWNRIFYPYAFKMHFSTIYPLYIIMVYAKNIRFALYYGRSLCNRVCGMRAHLNINLTLLIVISITFTSYRSTVIKAL